MLTVMVSISILIKLPVWLWGSTLLLPSHRGALIIGLKVDDSIRFFRDCYWECTKKWEAHCDNRAAYKPFYGLQSAGIKHPGVDSKVLHVKFMKVLFVM